MATFSRLFLAVCALSSAFAAENQQIASAAPRVRNIGHRGFSGQNPENTLISFRRSLQEFAAIELDVQVTSDGKVIVLHDETVDRTTNGTGRINLLHSEYARSLDAGKWKGPQFAGERLPFMQEAVELLTTNTAEYARIHLDTKYLTPQILPQMQAVVARFPASVIDRLEIGVWSMDGATRVQNDAPALRNNIFLITSLAPAVSTLPTFRQLGFRGFSVGTGLLGLTQEFVQAAQREGFLVYCWTVNTEDAIRRVFSWGVDGIVGDWPDRVRRVIEGGFVEPEAATDADAPWISKIANPTADALEMAKGLFESCRHFLNEQGQQPLVAGEPTGAEKFLINSRHCNRAALSEPTATGRFLLSEFLAVTKNGRVPL